MNNSPIINKNFKDLAHFEGSSGREDLQYGWHEFFSILFKEKTVLDVGSGLGQSKERLSKYGNKVTTQDVAPNLNVDISQPINEIEREGFQIVSAFDVIEHIEKDIDFIKELWEICTEGIFMSTPNFTNSKCRNRCHIREYTPKQLYDIGKYFSSNVITWASFKRHGYDPNLLEKEDFFNNEGKSLGILIQKT